MTSKKRESIFNEKDLDGNLMKGQITIGSEVITAYLDPELDDPTDRDFKKIEKLAHHLIEHLNQSIAEILKNATKEIVDSAYSQQDYSPTESDYQKLRSDMKLHEINFFEDGALMTYRAPSTYPSNDLTIQINEEGEIEDVCVY